MNDNQLLISYLKSSTFSVNIYCCVNKLFMFYKDIWLIFDKCNWDSNREKVTNSDVLITELFSGRLSHMSNHLSDSLWFLCFIYICLWIIFNLSNQILNIYVLTSWKVFRRKSIHVLYNVILLKRIKVTIDLTLSFF